MDMPSGMKLETSLANHGMMEQNGISENSLMNELELLLQEKHNVENNDRERDLTIYRSGSAPPTVQGSLDAIGSLCRKPELGKAKDGGGCINGIMSEEEMRSHPAYLAYYYSHDNINPRLPPPLLSKEEWRMQQRIRGNGLTLGAIGDLRKKGSINIEDKSSFFPLQPVHSVQNGVIDSSLLHTNNLSQQASNEWHDKSSDGLVGFKGSRLGGRRRSFADILQDGLDRPASLSGPLSCPASRTAFGDLANSADLCDLLETEESGLVRVKSHSSMVSHLVPTSTGYPLPIHSTHEVPPAGRYTISSFSSAGGVFPGRMTQNINGRGSCSSSREKVPDVATSLSSLSLSENSLSIDGNIVQSHIQQGFDLRNTLISDVPNGAKQHHRDLSIAEKVSAPSISADRLTKDEIMKNYSVAKASFDGQLSFPKRTTSSANLNSQHCSLLAGGLDGIQNHFQNAKFAPPGCTLDKYSVNQNFNSAARYHLDADLTCNGGSDNHVQPNNCLLGIDSSQLQRSSYATSTPSSQNCDLRGNFVSPPPGELVGLQKAHLETLLAQHKRKLDLSLLRKSQGNNGYYEHLSYELGMEYPGVTLGNSLHALQPRIPMLQNHRHFTSVMKSSVGGSMGLWNTDVRAGMDGRLSMNLLEELKNNKTRCFELSDIVGHVVEFSMDQCGSRFIQQKLETAAEEEKMKIFPEIVPHARTLMSDVFGNYVIQKLFEHGTESQRKELTSQLTGHVLALSLQMYGCRVIQKAVEMVDLDEKIQMVGELNGSVMKCVRDQNGNHVIQKCIECVPEDQIQFIISAFYGQVILLSTHPYGCRVIQRVLEHCHDPSTQKIIMDEIMGSVCHLAHDQYGNYVIQHVLRHGKAQERSVIIGKLAGQIVKMSQQKFASNVIEKCLAFGSPEERQLLVDEMLVSTDENEPLQAMMKDQFGNYVVQKVLETSDVGIRELIVSRIKVHLNALKKYTYGKHIVARVEMLLTSAERRTAPP